MDNLITIQQLKDGYLAGVKLIDSNGVPIPDFAFENAITSARSWFENQTKIRVLPYQVNSEPHDFYQDEWLKFSWIQLYEYPIQSVTQIQAVYPTGQTILLFPSTWIKVYTRPGTIQLVPTAGTLTQVLLGQGGWYIPLLSGYLSYLPQLFFVTYTAGYATGQIPAVVNDVIGMRAATYILNLAGRMVLEPGIQSKSLGIDGLGQTMSAMAGRYGPYSGAIQDYLEKIEQAITMMQQRERGIPLTVL